MIRFIIGIDPGFSGALGLFMPETGALAIQDMPTLTTSKGKTEIDHIGLFEALRPTTGTNSIMAVLERVAARPGQGAPATFRFGQGYGAIEMALAAHRIPVHYVTPAQWKKHFKLSKDKGASRGLAQQRFPQFAETFKRVKDDGRAEASLIALYGHEKLT